MTRTTCSIRETGACRPIQPGCGASGCDTRATPGASADRASSNPIPNPNPNGRTPPAREAAVRGTRPHQLAHRPAALDASHPQGAAGAGAVGRRVELAGRRRTQPTPTETRPSSTPAPIRDGTSPSHRPASLPSRLPPRPPGLPSELPPGQGQHTSGARGPTAPSAGKAPWARLCGWTTRSASRAVSVADRSTPNSHAGCMAQVTSEQGAHPRLSLCALFRLAGQAAAGHAPRGPPPLGLGRRVRHAPPRGGGGRALAAVAPQHLEVVEVDRVPMRPRPRGVVVPARLGAQDPPWPVGLPPRAGPSESARGTTLVRPQPLGPGTHGGWG